MKNIKLFLAFIGIFLFQSCNTSDDIINLPKEVNGNLVILDKVLVENVKTTDKLIFVFNADNGTSFKFESFNLNDHLISTFKFKNGNSNWEELNVFEINLLSDYKQKINPLIEEKATVLKNQLAYSKIEEISNVLEELPELLFNELERKEYYNEVTLAVFYHLSIFKTSKRAFEKNTKDCKCSVYEESTSNKTPFFCSEDKLINTNQAYDFISKTSLNKRIQTKQFYPQKTLTYLKNNANKYLSVSKIEKILNDELKYFWVKKLTHNERNQFLKDNNLLNSKLTVPTCWFYGASSGGDCGCCGNYSGTCWYCNLGCYLHDVACEDCGWGCGWACVSGPC